MKKRQFYQFNETLSLNVDEKAELRSSAHINI